MSALAELPFRGPDQRVQTFTPTPYEVEIHGAKAPVGRTGEVVFSMIAVDQQLARQVGENPDLTLLRLRKLVQRMQTRDPGDEAVKALTVGGIDDSVAAGVQQLRTVGLVEDRQGRLVLTDSAQAGFSPDGQHPSVIPKVLELMQGARRRAGLRVV